MEFDKVIRERFATRSFKNESISTDLINKILESATLAPTAKNQQPQRIYVVKSEAGLKKIDEASPCRYNAPVVLLVCSDKEQAWSNGEYSSFEMDATIAATHMILAATNLGLNSVWVLMFDKKLIKEKFELPDSIEPICLIPIGYKEDNCSPSPLHSNRKSIEDISKYV